MFKVLVSVPIIGQPGDVVSQEEILQREPNADIPWMVSVGTLVQIDGVEVKAKAKEKPASDTLLNENARLKADLEQAKEDFETLNKECEALKDKVARLEEELAKAKAELEDETKLVEPPVPVPPPTPAKGKK